ncbi:MAG: PKD domain-containing protein [Saprospiraceae bacterium]|nr:PKD domain-containing protein [Saprospiraceae bacterium]
MKTLMISIALLFVISTTNAQTTVFSDNFESGSSSWTLTGTWGLSTTHYHSSNHSLTESPAGNYANSLSITATMANGVNLTSALSAELKFWAIYDIEAGFDYMYVDVSANGGISWTNIDIFDDTSSVWTQYTYSLGGFVGNASVKVRFRFISDVGWTQDGMYIDDLIITSDTVDNAPPLILHTPPDFHHGSLSSHTANADIIDVSGLSVAQLIYRVDGGSFNTVTGINSGGNAYNFTVPAQSPGASVDYYIYAKDNSTAQNQISTDTFNYISGQYIGYDNANVDFVDSIYTGTGAAVRITLQGTTQLVTMLLRNYTDINRPNDSMLVHVWSSVGGMPGLDLITPFKVYPTANLQVTSPMTVIDLRPYASSLSNLTGDIFIGYTVPSGVCWLNITQPGIASRSYNYSGSAWAAATGTSGSSDYHFRAITSGAAGGPVANFGFDLTNSPTVVFSDSTLNNPTSWSWNFDNLGSTSALQNPTYTFTSNGSYNVCLTATNSVGSDTKCKLVIINTIPAPVADFSFDTIGDPSVSFTDLSTNSPTSWLWNFDHNGATSTLQNPTHIFPAIGGTFNVCLIASSANGNSTPFCQNVILTVGTAVNEITIDDKILIYPNPMVGKSTIEIINCKSNNTVFNLYDIGGKKLNIDYTIVENGIEISKGNLKKGTYIYEIINDKDKYSGKLIVQ